MAATWFTGFEYGLATPSVNGTGLIDAITGACTIRDDTGIPHTGTYALRTVSGAATLSYISRNIAAGRTYVGRFYIYMTTLPSTDRIIFSITTTGHKIQILWDVTQVSFSIGIDGATTQLGTVTVALNTWYCVDIKAITSANPWLIDWQIDSVAQTQLSYAHAAEDMSVIDFGIRTVGTLTAWYDDIIHGVTSGDYPYGPGGTWGLRPNADGVHNNAANIMEDSAGNDIDGATYFAWSKLDEDPWVSTANSDYIRQTGNGAANYCEIVFSDVPSTPYSYLGVIGLLEYASATTTANTGGCILTGGAAAADTLWGASGALADYSETSAYYKFKVMGPPLGGWGDATVNGVKSRFGYSDDADPDPYWLAIMLEVAYGFAPSSMLVSNAGFVIEYDNTTRDHRVSNIGLGVEYIPDAQLRVSNVGLIVEYVTYAWVPGPAVWIT
jgi:hypothetical protein